MHALKYCCKDTLSELMSMMLLCISLSDMQCIDAISSCPLYNFFFKDDNKIKQAMIQ